MLHASTDVHVCAFSAGPFTLNRAPLEARHSQGMCTIRLAAGLSCLSACLLDQACWFPLLPLNHHLVVFCIHKCISCELCVQMPPRGQIFSRFLVLCFLLWTLIRGGKLPRRLAFESPSLVMDLRHSSRLMCVSQRLYPSFKPIVVDLRFILVQHYLCLQTQNSEETNRSVSLAHSPCVWWCLRLLCCCPAVAGVLCMIMHCPGSAGYCCCLRRIGAGLCSKAAAQASPT